MAEKEKDTAKDTEKQAEQIPGPQGSDRVQKPGGVVQSILIVLLALLVVAVVFSGVFYFAVKNNMGGIAEILRPRIENNPILKLALPPKPGIDPDDPKNLTAEELVKKYNEYRKKVTDLNDKLTKANSTIAQMEQTAKNTTDPAITLQENQKVLDAIRAEQQKLDDDKKKLSEMIAKGDTTGFKDYYQKIDKATADAVYKELVTQDITNQNKVMLAKPFATMQASSAAKVLTELYAKDQTTLLDIFEGMKPATAALILEQMDAATAADITKMLSDRKLGR
ncbi:MAG: hypothetical protein N2376_03025 [Clostridia bacterium]|nr:hypothetical protein [Clostridia bacterium]